MTPLISLRRMGLHSVTLLVLSCVLLFLTPVTALAQSYRIQPGDVLRVEVLEDATLNRTVLVAPDGRISLPSAGTIRAAGRTIEAIQNTLVTRLSPIFASTPNVFVGIEGLAERAPAAPPEPEVVTIFVMGEARNPGGLDLEPGTTVLQAFAVMGGFTNFAATKRVQLRRAQSDGTEKIYTLNYDAIVAGTSPNGRTVLHDGDVILVPQRRLFE